MKQACDRLQLCRQTVASMCESDEIYGKKVRGRWRISAKSIDDYLNSDNFILELFRKTS